MGKRVLITCTDSMMKQFLEPHVLHLVENGFDVEIACSEVLGRMSEIWKDLGRYVRIHQLSMRRSPLSGDNLKGYKEVKRIIDDGRFDLIWTNEPVMGVLTRLAARKARKTGAKVLYMAHGFHFYQGAPKKNWLVYYPVEKWMTRYTDKLITINEEDYQFAKQHFSCPVYHIHGVGANSTKFHPISKEEQSDLRKRLGFDGHIILNVGELNPNKNQKTAILAVKEVLKQYPDTVLLIAGKGEERDTLEKLVEEHGLREKVVFLGYKTNLEQFAQICDMLISCSYREGLPLNILEAMLCGKPVVASDNRGHRELVHDGINGYLVEADDIGAYVQYICQILEEGKDYSEQTVRSAQMYTDVHVMKELAAIYFEGQQA